MDIQRVICFLSDSCDRIMVDKLDLGNEHISWDVFVEKLVAR